VTDQPDNKADQTRDGKGRYDRDPETVKRDARAAELRAKSWTYQQIGDDLGMSRQSAYEAVQRALADTLEEPGAAVRAMELAKLDAMERAVLGVLEREHVTVQHGKVVKILDAATGQEKALLDDSPILQAVDRLLRIAERRARLLGLDAEKRINVSGGLTYEVVGVDPEDLT
jgi:hypothetical protein